MAPTSPTGTDRAIAIAPHNDSCHRPQTPGFTLIELLVALAILAVLSAALSPLLLPTPARTLSAAAGEMVVALRETRRLAQSMHARQAFVVDTAANRYAVDGQVGWRSLPAGSTAEITTAESLISEENLGAIAFFPDGSSSGGRIKLGLGGHVRQIDVEWLTGRIVLAGTAP